MKQNNKKHKIKYINEGFDFNQAQIENDDNIIIRALSPDEVFTKQNIKGILPDNFEIETYNNDVNHGGLKITLPSTSSYYKLEIKYYDLKDNNNYTLNVNHSGTDEFSIQTFEIIKKIYEYASVLGNFNITNILLNRNQYADGELILIYAFNKKDMKTIPDLLDKITINTNRKIQLYLIAEGNTEHELNEVYGFINSHNTNNQFKVLKGKLTGENISETSVRNAKDFFGAEDPVEFLKNNYIYQPDNIKIEKLDNTIVQNAISQLRVKLKYVKYTVKDELIWLAILYKKLGLGFVMPELLLTKQNTYYEKIVSLYFSDYIDGKLVKNMNSHALGNLRIAIEEAMERGISLKMIMAMVLIIDKIPE